MSSKNKTCDVLKWKRNLISFKTKLDQIGNSDSMSYLKFDLRCYDLRHICPEHSTTYIEGILYTVLLTQTCYE